MKRFNFVLLFSLLLLFCAAETALASGTLVGNGGDAVVCFNGNADKFVNDGRITPEGRSHVTSVVPLEVQQMRLTLSRSDLATRSAFLPYEDAYSELLNSLRAIPKLHRNVREIHNQLGWISNGFGVADGLEDIADSGRIQSLPQNCAEIQAVIRQVDQLFFDSFLWSKMDGFSKAVIQLHEEFYMFSKHSNSANTRLLIVTLLTRNVSEKEFMEKLYRYQFGGMNTLAYVEQKRQSSYRSALSIESEARKFVEAYAQDTYCESRSCKSRLSDLKYEINALEELNSNTYDDSRNLSIAISKFSSVAGHLGNLFRYEHAEIESSFEEMIKARENIMNVEL